MTGVTADIAGPGDPYSGLARMNIANGLIGKPSERQNGIQIEQAREAWGRLT